MMYRLGMTGMMSVLVIVDMYQQHMVCMIVAKIMIVLYQHHMNNNMMHLLYY